MLFLYNETEGVKVKTAIFRFWKSNETGREPWRKGGGRLGKCQTSVKWLAYVPATDGNNQGLNFSITEQNNPKDNRNVKPTKTSQKSLYPIILIQIS